MKTRLRGAYDWRTVEKRRERLKTLRKLLSAKDERGFLDFLRKNGISDETEEFAELRRVWLEEIGKW